MKRWRLRILNFIVWPVLFVCVTVFAESIQFPDIEKMEIPKLELNIEVKKVPFSKELKTWDITEEA